VKSIEVTSDGNLTREAIFAADVPKGRTFIRLVFKGAGKPAALPQVEESRIQRILLTSS
jgi:hypothetical protein